MADWVAPERLRLHFTLIFIIIATLTANSRFRFIPILNLIAEIYLNVYWQLIYE